jgi:tRNA pseudouridine38-40 synthase
MKRKLEEIVAISTRCLPQISPQENLKYEQLYLEIQSTKKSKKEDHVSSCIVKKPKRKVVLLMSYCGSGYQGMQINPDVPSIELDLHKALVSAGAVSLDNAMDANKISFVRCARTDKGVHAAGQVVSLKMIIEDADIIEKINSKLPKQIRVWGYGRVNNSFHAKNMCDSRIYEYILPSYCLMDCNPIYYPFSRVAQGIINEPILDFVPKEIPMSTAEQIKIMKDYRIDETRLIEFGKLLKQFEGTRNHHNYTVGKSFQDKSSNRFIMSFEVGKPFVKDIEWISCKVHGQSFMIHQIRKMIGISIMMIRTKTPIDLLEKTFTETRINVPKAPGLGLLLERPVFEQYNKRLGIRSDLCTIDFNQYKTQIEEFKQEWIYNEIIKTETDSRVFEEWLRVIDSCSNDYGWYLNADGTIDENRRNPDLFKKGLNIGRNIPMMK